jgi:5-methylcytosine-specific restriction enzyme subunit McrC
VTIQTKIRIPEVPLQETILLKEYEDHDVELSGRDAEFIFRELAGRITIRRDIRGQRFTLNSAQYVGIITLPSGRRIEIKPKIPVSNLFYMLAVVFQMPALRPEVVQLERLDEIFELVAIYFSDLVERHIAQGLYRWYVEREDNLPAVRGRISFVDDFRRNCIERQRSYCRFDEFTWDVPENQIIRQTCHFLSGWQFRPQTRIRLGQLDAELGEITGTHFSSKDLDKIQYHRLNEGYRQVHHLCRLFLEGASLSESLGIFNFQAFLIDMNKLFEDFVSQVLRERAFGKFRVETQDWVHLDQSKKILMKPDILIRRAGAIVLAADCKYKKLEEHEFNNQDVYQLLAYCTATKTRRGLLIYPQHLKESRKAVQILNTEIGISLISIDLGKELTDLGNSCAAFADAVLACT